MRRSHFVVKSLTHGSWSGNIVNRKPPRGEGFLSIKVYGASKDRMVCWERCSVSTHYTATLLTHSIQHTIPPLYSLIQYNTLYRHSTHSFNTTHLYSLIQYNTLSQHSFNTTHCLNTLYRQRYSHSVCVLWLIRAQLWHTAARTYWPVRHVSVQYTGRGSCGGTPWPCLIHMCAMTHFYVCYGSFLCMPWLIRVCPVTHSYSYVCHDSFLRVPWLILTCAMTHSYVCHDSFLRVPCHDSHTCATTQSYMRSMREAAMAHRARHHHFLHTHFLHTHNHTHMGRDHVAAR